MTSSRYAAQNDVLSCVQAAAMHMERSMCDEQAQHQGRRLCMSSSFQSKGNEDLTCEPCFWNSCALLPGKAFWQRHRIALRTGCLLCVAARTAESVMAGLVPLLSCPTAHCWLVTSCREPCTHKQTCDMHISLPQPAQQAGAASAGEVLFGDVRSSGSKREHAGSSAAGSHPPPSSRAITLSPTLNLWAPSPSCRTSPAASSPKTSLAPARAQ